MKADTYQARSCRKFRCSCPARSRAAVNRALETIPGNSIIAVLSTSALLLPVSTTDASAPVSPMPEPDRVAGGAISGISSLESACDIFVAFEKVRSSFSARSSCRSPGEAPGELAPREDGSQRSPAAEKTRYDQYGHVRCPNDADSESEGLLITVSPSNSISNGQDERRSEQARGDRGASSGKEEGEGQDRHKRANDTKRVRLEAGTPPPQPAAIRQSPGGTRLSDVAPLPLLVFDTETFLALGELDERFAFQGGVAEWISRARSGSIDQGGGFSADKNGSCCCDVSARRRHGSLGRGRSACSNDTVQHVHAREWGKRLVGSWPDENARPSRDSLAAAGKPVARSPGAEWRTNDVEQQGEIGMQASRPGEKTDVDETSRSRNIGDPRAYEESIVDQWTRLPPAKLEALVQADADLFFLPLLLLQHSSGEHIYFLS